MKNRFYFYELDAENIGGVNSILFWVLMIIAFGFFVYAIVCVAGIYNLAYMNPIQQYLRENSSVSLSDIETDFNEAHLVESHVWIGKIWTIFMAGNKAKILVNRDLTWGYHYCGNGLNSVSQMRLYTNIQYEAAYINLSESGTKEALKIYEEEQPHILTRYNLELERLYEQDFNAFLELNIIQGSRKPHLPDFHADLISTAYLSHIKKFPPVRFLIRQPACIANKLYAGRPVDYNCTVGKF